MPPGQEANDDNIGIIVKSTHNIQFHNKIKKIP